MNESVFSKGATSAFDVQKGSEDDLLTQLNIILWEFSVHCYQKLCSVRIYSSTSDEKQLLFPA